MRFALTVSVQKVDDSNSTLLSVGEVLTSFFGTTFEFFNLVESTVIRVLDDIEEINEQHVSGWTKMITNSKPPVTNGALSPYMDKYALEKHVVGFTNDKFKSIIGYKLKHPEFNHNGIKDMVDKWKAEGSWPTLE